LLKYKETNPIPLEERIYELRKEAKQNPANAFAKEAEIHALEFLRMFWGPMFNAKDMSKFSKGPMTGKVYGPDKPIMMRDLDDPEKNLYTYTPEEQKALMENFKASRDLLGMGIGNLDMLRQYGTSLGLVPHLARYTKSLNIDPKIVQQVLTSMKPFRSLWWSYSDDVPKEEMPSMVADSKLPYEQRIANMLASTPRGVALPTEEMARRELEAEVEPEGMERGVPIDPMKGLKEGADPFGKKGLSELDDPGWADIRNELFNYQPDVPKETERVIPTKARIPARQPVPQGPRSFLWQKPEVAPEFQPKPQTLLSGGMISDFMRDVAHARRAVQQSREQPRPTATTDPWEGQRKLMGRKRGSNQPYYREDDPASMAQDYSKGPDPADTASSPVTPSPTLGQMKARTMAAKVPGQQTFEGQDACDRFMQKYTVETAEKGGFSVAGRPSGGRSITGEKRMAKFYGQGDGSGERKSAVLGIKHVTPQSTIKQTFKSKNITQNKPSYQLAKRLRELVAKSPTERNNKPDLGMNVSVKPGPFKGQKMGSIKDKMDIRPKPLEIDGGLA